MPPIGLDCKMREIINNLGTRGPGIGVVVVRIRPSDIVLSFAADRRGWPM